MSHLLPRTARSDGSVLTAFDLGAHVVTWELHGAPVLWLSPQAVIDGSAPIRGGVPIIFPWFDRGREGNRSPKHGVARTSTWRPVTTDESSLAWELSETDVAGREGADALPGPFTCRCTAQLSASDQLRLTLEVTNTDAQEYAVEAALHTYLTVGDVRHTRLLGLEGADFYDKVAGQHRTQQGEVTFDGETDRVYERSGTVVVVDPVLGRTLIVEPVGGTQTIVWNPGAELASRIDDVPDDGWHQFVCVETGATGTAPLTVAAGQTVTLGFVLGVGPAPAEDVRSAG